MFFALGGALGEEYPIDLLNKKLLTCLIGTCVDLNGHQLPWPAGHWLWWGWQRQKETEREKNKPREREHEQRETKSKQTQSHRKVDGEKDIRAGETVGRWVTVLPWPVVEVSRDVPTCKRQIGWLGQWGSAIITEHLHSTSSASQWDRKPGAESGPLFPGAWELVC